MKGSPEIMRIAVCEDDQAIRKELLKLIKKQVPEVDITEYKSGEEMINAREDFNICFLDVEMKKISGIDIAKYIREQEENSKHRSIIIFVTGYREYMEETFDVNAFHYLVKPVDVEKFSEVFGRTCKEVYVFQEQTKKYIIVKNSGIHRKLLLKNIYYYRKWQ